MPLYCMTVLVFMHQRFRPLGIQGVTHNEVRLNSWEALALWHVTSEFVLQCNEKVTETDSQLLSF